MGQGWHPGWAQTRVAMGIQAVWGSFGVLINSGLQQEVTTT